MQPFCRAWALWQSAAALRTLPPERQPVVSGTLRLEPSEVEGKAPLFVDAFLDADGLHASVVLSYSPLYNGTNVGNSSWLHWGTAHWVCSWYSPNHDDFSSMERGVMLHDTPADWGPEDFNASRVKLKLAWKHHSMVVGCPLPFTSQDVSSMLLDITASRDDVELYARRGMTVQSTAFVKAGADLVLCTMFDGVVGADLVWPWAKFHIMVGFQQVLIYVENANISGTELLVHDLVQSGHVTLVPFYFGGVSDQHRFYMQAAMEQHCLFQARGRTAWLGHSDVDEFFELRPSMGQRRSMRDFLHELPPDTAAVEVRSQMWHLKARLWDDSLTAGDLNIFPFPLWQLAFVPFPCSITCKGPGYNSADRATKWIARPTMVELCDPHHVSSNVSNGTILSPDPDLTLRLNHFRHCVPGGSWCSGEGDCEEDGSFSQYCSAAMRAPLPSSHAR